MNMLAESVEALCRSHGAHGAAFALDEGRLVLSGAAPDIAARRRLVREAAALPGVTCIVDRLQLGDSEPRGDRAIRDSLRDAFYADTAFENCQLVAIDRGTPTVLRRRAAPIGRVVFEIEDGVVSLDGALPQHALKQRAGLHAWRVGGRRDVINGIAVEAEVPPEALAEAVRGALASDHALDASELAVEDAESGVRLLGRTPSDAQRRRAECNAWYIDGVADVINDIAAAA